MTFKEKMILIPLIILGAVLAFWFLSDRTTAVDWEQKVNACAEDDLIGFSEYPADDPDDLVCLPGRY